jgi:hypothetical protein
MIKARYDARDLRKIASIKDGIAKAIIATNVQLWNDLVEPNPVDTGFSRAMWWVQLDGVGGHPSPPIPGQTGIPAPDTPAALLASAGRRMVIANGANYIQKLEAGFSAKAPDGWVAQAAARYRSNFKRNAAAIGKAGGKG